MKKLFTLVVTSVMLSLAVSCGSNGPQVLKGVKVETSTVNNDLMVSISAEMNLGSMTFPAATIPIINPRNQTPIGQVELVPVLGGKNLLKISVNASELSGINTGAVALPNGNLVPLIANNAAVSIRLPGNAQLYLAISENVTAIGVALPLAPFDAIGANLPGLNFFPVIAMDKVIAAAGIFTGRPGQNGIAFIADISQVVNEARNQSMGLMAMQAEEVQADDIQLNYSSQIPSAKKKAALEQALLRLNQQKAKLYLHK